MNDGEYREGKKHGYWTTYYANGNKRSEGEYVEGVKNGTWIQYWQNGKVKSQGVFVMGAFTGEYSGFHENGNLAYRGMYNLHNGTSTDNTKQGDWNYYNPDGTTVWRVINYHRGSRTRPDQHPAARVMVQEPINE